MHVVHPCPKPLDNVIRVSLCGGNETKRLLGRAFVTRFLSKQPSPSGCVDYLFILFLVRTAPQPRISCLDYRNDPSIETKWSTSAKVPLSGRIREENDRDGSLSEFISFLLDIMVMMVCLKIPPWMVIFSILVAITNILMR
jgi:hypothetical protein